jgi:hypothetical protein
MLRRQINSESSPAIEPITADTFLARSILQKAIRRGDTALALRAAKTLLLSDPQVLWRRLLVIALEDLGIHEWRLLQAITAVESSKSFRATVGTDEQVAKTLVVEACKATRCQAANELHILARYDSRYDETWRALKRLPVEDALDLAGNEGAGLGERHVAALVCLGFDETLRWLQPKVPIQQLFGRLSSQAPPEIVELYARTFKTARLPLSWSSLLLHVVNGTPREDEPVYVTDDPLPPSIQIGEVPSYALDQYTRSGRAALREYVDKSERWKAFAKALKLTRQEQATAAGELFFRIESAAVTRRRSWDIGRVIREQAMPSGCHLSVPLATEGLQLAFEEVPLLNEYREQLI